MAARVKQKIMHQTVLLASAHGKAHAITMLCVKYERLEGEHKLSSDNKRRFKLCCTSLYPITNYSLHKPGSISYMKDAEACLPF